MSKVKHTVVLTGVVKRSGGYGFALVFGSDVEAQHYKKMFDIILRSDKYKTEVTMGYYDKQEK
jgi:phosphotransferase system IIB component